jgi:acyl-CoA thioesterase-1
LLGTPAAAIAEAVTVAALGDSLTEGYGLPPEDGFVPRLQRWLDARRAEAIVLNAGVSGDTTAGGLSRIDWTLTGDVDALIVTLGGNDMLRGLPPAEARRNLDAILQAAGARGIPVLLSGMKAPGNYGADYKAAFDAIYPDLAASRGCLLHEDFLGPLRAASEAGTPLSQLLQPDGIHPSAEGVAMIVEAIGPKVEALIDRAAARAAP